MSIGSSIGEIDTQLEHHRIIMERLSRRRNEMVPIAHIPDDLITYIFELYLASFDPPDHNIRDHVPYAWQDVTQVCSHWRTLALQNPMFWTRIETARDVECIETMLARSSTAPLILRFRDQAGLDLLSQLRCALTASNRIWQMTLEVDSTVYFQLSDSLATIAPLLTSITLSHPTRSSLDNPVFNQLELPALTNLRVTNLGFSVASSLFRPTITHLHLSPSSYMTQNMDGFLRVLEKMPELASLFMHCCIPNIPHTDRWNQRDYDPAHLPKLQSISLCDLAHDSGWFLHHTEIPSSTVIKLDCTLDADQGRTNIKHPLARSIAHVLKGPNLYASPQVIRSLYCGHPSDSKDRASIRGHLNDLPVEDLGEEVVPPQFSILTQSKAGGVKAPRLLAEFPTVLLSDIYTLYVSCTRFHPTSSLCSLSNLRVLALRFLTPPIVADILSTRVGGESGDADPSKPLSLPRLRELVLSEIDFCYDQCQPFVDTLEVRKQHRIGIVRVVMNDCPGWASDWVDRLKLVVGDVHIRMEDTDLQEPPSKDT